MLGELMCQFRLTEPRSPLGNMEAFVENGNSTMLLLFEQVAVKLSTVLLIFLLFFSPSGSS